VFEAVTVEWKGWRGVKYATNLVLMNIQVRLRRERKYVDVHNIVFGVDEEAIALDFNAHYKREKWAA